MPIDSKRKILFIHIPKTGGSSIENALNLHPNQVTDAKEYLSGTGKHLQHLTYNEICSLKSKDEIFNFNKFCIIRNPIDRFYSEFRWRKKIRHPIVENRNILDFANLLKEKKIEDTLKNECHYRFQSDYFYKDKKPSNEIVVFRFENGMKVIEEWLGDVANIKVNIPHKNKTDNKNELKDKKVDKIIEFIYEEDFKKIGY